MTPVIKFFYFHPIRVFFINFILPLLLHSCFICKYFHVSHSKYILHLFLNFQTDISCIIFIVYKWIFFSVYTSNDSNGSDSKSFYIPHKFLHFCPFVVRKTFNIVTNEHFIYIRITHCSKPLETASLYLRIELSVDLN